MEIQTVGARKKLPIGGDIHWHRTATAAYIGFRRTGEASGTWWARWYDGAAKRQRYQRLGDYPGMQPSKQYDAAATDAAKWFRECEIGIRHAIRLQTVADACRAYVVEAEKEAAQQGVSPRKASDAKARFRRYVDDDPIGRIKLRSLRSEHLEEWKDRLIKQPALVSRNPKKKKIRDRSLATVNRDMASVRAALNLARKKKAVESDIEWREILKPFKGVDKKRDIYLPLEERRALLAAADEEVRPFLKGLMLLPLRPGALAGLNVGDLNKRNGSLIIRSDKANKGREIGLPKDTVSFFSQQTRGKLPAAPLFARVDGRRWNKDSWKGPIKDAVISAGIRPDATAYALRHSTITDLCVSTGNSLLVAQISGTSVAMIEKHYWHVLSKHSAEALAGLAL